MSTTATTAPSTLPDGRRPIADPDLLHLFIRTRYDIHRLSHLTDISVPDLLTWLAEPHTRRTLQHLRAAAEEALTLRTIETRRTALDALEDVINTTDDPVEKRRAASALLRALSTRPAHSPHPDGKKPGDGSVSSAPPSAPPRDSRLKTQDSPQASKPSLDAMLAHLAEALARDRADSPTADNALAALHAACADDATLNDRPIPADLDDFLDDAGDLQRLAPITRVDVAPPTLAQDAAATRLHCTHADGATTHIGIALVHDDDWRIVAIATDHDDTS